MVDVGWWARPAVPSIAWHAWQCHGAKHRSGVESREYGISHLVISLALKMVLQYLCRSHRLEFMLE